MLRRDFAYRGIVVSGDYRNVCRGDTVLFPIVFKFLTPVLPSFIERQETSGEY